MHYLIWFVVKLAALFGLLITLIFLFFMYLHRHHVTKKIAVWSLIVILLVLLFFSNQAMNTVLSFDYFMKTVGPADGPQMPVENAFSFLMNVDNLREVDIAKDPHELAFLPKEKEVTYTLEAEEVINEIAPGIFYNSWTYNGKIPGPFLRAKAGNKVTIKLKNKETSLHVHSIDLHAVTGPGGGASVMQVAPGEERSFTFLAKNPGLYVYHCATPNVGVHMAHGMYGLILIEPEEELPPVDKEFYVMQGEFYTKGDIGMKGLQIFDVDKYLAGDPTYVVFNGKAEALNGKMKARVGDRIRIFMGNGGVNLISSFHVIGEIFDAVYPESGTPLQKDIQTTLIPAGGASIVEFTIDLPGRYILVDHSLARLDKGAWGILEVEGTWNESIFSPQPSGSRTGH